MWFDLTHHAVWAATETAQAGLRRFVQVEAAHRIFAVPPFTPA
jgi:hypothetical protein